MFSRRAKRAMGYLPNAAVASHYDHTAVVLGCNPKFVDSN
jgi:hypothetical protein